MNIAIDVDEVLRDFVGQLIIEYKKDFPDHDVTPVESWDVSLSFPIGHALYDYFKLTRPREIFEYAPVLKGAQDMCEELRQDGHILWLVTSQEKGNEVYTCNWLAKNYISYDHLVFTSQKDRVVCDVLLDDGMHNLEAFKKTGGIAVCMDKPWNKDWDGYRVTSMYEFYDLVKTLSTGRPQ